MSRSRRRSPEGLLSRLAGLKATPLYQMTRMTGEMLTVIERALTAVHLTGGLRRLYLDGKVLELLSLRLAQLGIPDRLLTDSATVGRHARRLREAKAIVEARIAEPPSLLELSRAVALSTTLLKRGFRELFGVSVFEHVRNLRLEQARAMLVEPGISVKQVARSVGYASLSHFAKAFRGEYGTSPSDAIGRPRPMDAEG